MRTHGWQGAPPRSDEEAVERILTAAKRIIDARGVDLRIADVARDVGVTRQTVYRYFPSTEDLLVAASVSEAGMFLTRLTTHLKGLNDPAEAVVEAIAFTLERLPREKYLGILLVPGRKGSLFANVTSDVALAFGRNMIEHFDVDWHGEGFTDEILDGMVEFMLRVLQSFFVDPGRPRRSPQLLRGYLREWVAPTIDHHLSQSRGTRHAALGSPSKTQRVAGEPGRV